MTTSPQPVNTFDPYTTDEPREFDHLPQGEEFTTGEFDLEDRHSLRRVAGLSTELEEISEVEYRKLRLERVVLAGVWTEGSANDAENSLIELAALAETAGSVVLEGIVQRRGRPDPATFIGTGKVNELRDIVLATGADDLGERAAHLPGEDHVADLDRVNLDAERFASARHLLEQPLPDQARAYLTQLIPSNNRARVRCLQVVAFPSRTKHFRSDRHATRIGVAILRATSPKQ
jgi:hypothetical protein